MSKQPGAPKKTCFVIGPIGVSESETRNSADWFLAHIKSTAECFGYTVVRADKITTPGLISDQIRSEEHTSELQSLIRISYAVFCLQTQIFQLYPIVLDNDLTQFNNDR